jgi:hypothetical protein
LIDHPAFAPFVRWWSPAQPGLPGIEELNRWARDARLSLDVGRTLEFVAAPPAGEPALDYERRIASTGRIATRPGVLHDVCNALCWLRYPQTKGALNAVHVGTPPSDSGSGRGRSRDAATLLDESGMLVACTNDEITELWMQHRWREAFRDRREEVKASLRPVAIGHGMLAKLVHPFRSMTARALLLPVDAATLPADPCALASVLDPVAARAIEARGGAFAPEDLLPLPIAALPGWDTEEKGAALFDDTAVFRPRVLR